MTNNISLLIADDHPIFRAGLRQVIEKDPRLTVIAEVDDGEAALALIRQLTAVSRRLFRGRHSRNV